MQPVGGQPQANPNIQPNWPVNLISVPLSVSVLFTAPIKKNLLLSPVAAFIVPLVESNVLFGALIVTAINLFISFLFRCGLARPPVNPYSPPGLNTITLSMPQLTQLMGTYMQGQPVDGLLRSASDSFGPLGGDEPLFPDNLSIGLVLAAPFADFDGSPDTNFNVPLIEVPGLQGSLIISLLILIGKFIADLGGVTGLDPKKLSDPADPPENQALLNYLMKLNSNGR